jgi:thymidylate kinase
MKHHLSNLLIDWNDRGILYCVWKGASKLQKVLECEEDLDVLLDKKNLQEAILILQKNDFVEFKNVISRSDLGTLDFLKFHENGKWTHVHLHLEVIFGNSLQRDYRLPIAHTILQDRVWDNNFNIWVISPIYDLSLFIIRHSLRSASLIPSAKYDLELKNIKEFYCNKQIIFKESEIASLNYFPQQIKNYLSHYHEIEESGIKQMSGKIKHFYFLQRESLDLYYLVSSLFNLISNISSKIRKKMGLLVYKKKLAHSGVLVAFVGIDGSGKSSAIERLSSNLSKQLTVSSISLGSGVSGASWYRKIVFKLFGTKAKFKGHINARSGRQKSLKSDVPWYYALWMIICLLDKKKELHRGLTCKARGGFVISDRWLQDEIQGFVDSPRVIFDENSNVINKYLATLEEEVFLLTRQNAPDFIVRFDTTPENSVLRKPNDLNLEQARDAALKIREIKWNNSPLISIDTNKSIEDVDRQLNNIVASILSGDSCV